MTQNFPLFFFFSILLHLGLFGTFLVLNPSSTEATLEEIKVAVGVKFTQPPKVETPQAPKPTAPVVNPPHQEPPIEHQSQAEKPQTPQKPARSEIKIEEKPVVPPPKPAPPKAALKKPIFVPNNTSTSTVGTVHLQKPTTNSDLTSAPLEAPRLQPPQSAPITIPRLKPALPKPFNPDLPKISNNPIKPPPPKPMPVARPDLEKSELITTQKPNKVLAPGYQLEDLDTNQRQQARSSIDVPMQETSETATANPNADVTTQDSLQNQASGPASPSGIDGTAREQMLDPTIHAQRQYNLLLSASIRQNLQAPQQFDSDLKITVELTIDPQGKLIRHQVLESSPNEAFNLASLRAVQTSRFPELPEELKKNPPYIVSVIISP